MRLDELWPGAEPVCLIAGGWGAELGMRSVFERFAAPALAERRAVWLLWDAAARGPECGPCAERADDPPFFGRPLEIVAWSFGVRLGLEWAARMRLSVSRFLAVAGTPWPVDRRLGIAPAVFHGTLEGFDDAKRLAFWRNLTGSADAPMPPGLERPAEAWRQELLAVKALAAELPPEAQALLQTLAARKAVAALIPARDRIVPPAAQRRAWAAAGVPALELPDEPHLPSALPGWEALSL